MSHHDEGKHVTGDYTPAEITEQMLRRKINMMEEELRNKDERIETLETALNEMSLQMKGMERWKELFEKAYRVKYTEEVDGVSVTKTTGLLTRSDARQIQGLLARTCQDVHIIYEDRRRTL